MDLREVNNMRIEHVAMYANNLEKEKEFYKKIVNRNLCISGQHVLYLGPGTGVLPRNMYQ